MQFSTEIWISKLLPEAILAVILLSLGMATRRLRAGDCLAIGRSIFSVSRAKEDDDDDDGDGRMRNTRRS